MTPAVAALVRETMDLTGAASPRILEEGAPVPGEDALAQAEGGAAFYLVGIIGGKDVGKSALVNALAGHSITAITSHGPGTESVVAYVHLEQEAAVRALLQREAPGNYRIVTHELPGLRRQVLLDLPDIDSHFESHLQVTRTMLRHMLYPIWVQSIEKYADRQPQQMLARVAEGNSPSNFLFCLNKVDQLRADAGARDGAIPRGAQELREDFSLRLATTLALPSPPEVLLVSAMHAERYELPALREKLSREKSVQSVRQSKDLAVRRQDKSLLSWLDRQELPQRADRMQRLEEEAQELVAERIGQPLMEQRLPRMLDDSSNRAALAERILHARVARWPLVNLVHTLLSPLFALVRSIGARSAPGLQEAGALVELHLGQNKREVATAVQSVFAQLRRSQPVVADLYGHNRLWEDMPSDAAAGELQRALAATIERQREAVHERFTRGGVIAPFFRWLLTIGALLWFPIVQPVLAAVLNGHDRSPRAIAGLLVSVLGVDYLLKSAVFLAIYFAVIWLALRWNTQRRVARFLSRWKTAEPAEASLSLNAQALEWMARLTDPIRMCRERSADLAQRAQTLRVELAA